MRKRNLFTIVKIILSVLILSIIVKSVNMPNLKTIVSSLNCAYVLIAVLITAVSILVRAYRWLYLMNYEQKLTTMKMAIDITFVGLALNIFMPAQSGDIAKSYFGYRWSGIKERMLSISLYDKIIAISSIAFLGVFAGIFYGNYLFAILAPTAFIPFIVIYTIKRNAAMSEFFYSLLDKFIKRKIDLKKFIDNISFEKSMVANTLLISIIGWLLTYVVLWLSFKMISEDPPLLYVFMVSPILTFGRLFPFTLNGIGSDEAIIVFLFKGIGFNAAQCFSAAVLYRIISLLLPGLMGLVIILLKREREKYHVCSKDS